MTAVRRLGRLLKTDPVVVLLAPEALVRLFLARIQLLFPFERTAPRLGVKSAETPPTAPVDAVPRIRQITRAIRIVSRYTPWKSTCMVRAVAGLKMLKRRGIGSTLYLGVSKDRAGRMIAHAWLRSGEHYVSGDDAMQGFVVVEKFASQPGVYEAQSSEVS